MAPRSSASPFPRKAATVGAWSTTRAHYFNRNIADEAHMYYGVLLRGVRPGAGRGVRHGWERLVGNGCRDQTRGGVRSTQCVAIADVYDNIAARLDGNVVGYACCVGKSSIGAFSHGYARTSANAPAKLFLPSTKIPVASVSKVVTALAAIRVLAKKNVSLDSAIGGHLPGDWKLDPYVASITFRRLLQHRSGIKDYGNNAQDYDDSEDILYAESGSHQEHEVPGRGCSQSGESDQSE